MLQTRQITVISIVFTLYNLLLAILKAETSSSSAYLASVDH